MHWSMYVYACAYVYVYVHTHIYAKNKNPDSQNWIFRIFVIRVRRKEESTLIGIGVIGETW